VFEDDLKLNRSQARLQLLNINDHLQTPYQLAIAMGAPEMAAMIDEVLRELQPQGDFDYQAIVSQASCTPKIGSFHTHRHPLLQRKKLDHAERMRKFRRKNRRSRSAHVTDDDGEDRA
jgi:hypothetical protein